MITKISYGIKNGELVSIHSVESGLKCNCFCVSCGGKLVARKGEMKIHHFAHHTDSNCSSSAETALHMAAKEVLKKEKRIILPPLIAFDTYDNQIVLKESVEVKFDEIYLEKKQGDFRPDIIGVKNGTKIFIEIAVSHIVDSNKRKKVEKLGVSMIEVDLIMLDDGFTEEELIQAVIYDQENKEWIYNVKKEKLFNKQLNSITTVAKKSEQNLNIKPFELHISPFICKSLISDKTKLITGNSEIHTLFRNGKFWNGEMYGKGENGKYIYIDNEKKYIFPPSWAIRLSENEEKKSKKLYGQLNQIIRDSILSSKIANKCPNFDINSGACNRIPICKKFDPLAMMKH
jgi:hypothetical protein